jgi:m7GpppX diphosphatase
MNNHKKEQKQLKSIKNKNVIKDIDYLKLTKSDNKTITFIDSQKNKIYIDINALKMIINNECLSNIDTKYINRRKCITYTETIDLYNKTIKPFISNNDKKWIYNIIDGIEEQHKIIYQNDNYVILPDTAWVDNDINDLYLLLIVKRKDIYSIRDLTGEHIPLLTDMINSLEEIERIYKIPQCMLRTYFHYKPSTWHLHLHINNINTTKPYSFNVERCHSLINVINNLKIDTNYYKKVDIEIIKNI